MGCCPNPETARLNRQGQHFAKSASRAEEENRRRRVVYYVDGADGKIYGPWRTTIEADLIATKKAGEVRPEFVPYTIDDPDPSVPLAAEVDDAGAEFWTPPDDGVQAGWRPPDPTSGIVGDADPMIPSAAPTAIGGVIVGRPPAGTQPDPALTPPAASVAAAPATVPLAEDPDDGLVTAPEPVQDGAPDPDEVIDLSTLTETPPAIPAAADVDERLPGKPAAKPTSAKPPAAPKPKRGGRGHR